MGDLISRNRDLIIKRHEYAKTVASANIQAREIRIIEIEDEIQRNREDIVAQQKVIEEADKNIQQQRHEMEAEKA